MPPPMYTVASALWMSFLDCEDAVNVGHVIKVPFQFCELGSDIVAQRVTSTWWPVTLNCMMRSFDWLSVFRLST